MHSKSIMLIKEYLDNFCILVNISGCVESPFFLRKNKYKIIQSRTKTIAFLMTQEALWIKGHEAWFN